MSSFEPVVTCRSEKPTVVMLSNVQFIKDIKTAVLAADLIVNEFGFNEYQLMIYGARDRQLSYTIETYQLIADRNLGGNVFLKGFGNPKEVLKDAWLFMNSSLSEGLPLTIGEAALTGIPIVATEVGGTALVLTDPDDKACKYGEIVPPNDPLSLAQAQINLLAMLGHWAKYTDDIAPLPKLPDRIRADDVDWITKRMYEKTADRQKLGLKCREVVLKSFHGARYLREHEQMYWIQWHMARMNADERLYLQARLSFPFGVPEQLRYNADGRFTNRVDELDEEGRQVLNKGVKKIRWQDFQTKRK
jgi:glycosyltransferase involved in cell wall biosynthesis